MLYLRQSRWFMQTEERDTANLWDMLNAAENVSQFMQDVNFEDFMRGRKLQAAVECEVEIIGEAARRVSESFRENHSEIPWRAIIAQRNVLAHEYGEIKQERMWLVATEGVSDLIKKKPLVNIFFEKQEPYLEKF
jgi:uncharacterized protein with HEPN domain